MKLSAFDILGPIMVGPSSSHTAGALRIAQVAHSLAPANLTRVTFELYNSFSQTHGGHGTDFALAAGMLGFSADDEKIRNSLEIARNRGIDLAFVECGHDVALHPNTVRILMEGSSGRIVLRGASLGGGRVEIQAIDDVPVKISGEVPTIFVAHLDLPGVLRDLTSILAQERINVATARTFRSERGGHAFTVFELDEKPPAHICSLMKAVAHVDHALLIEIPGVVQNVSATPSPLDFVSAAELLKRCEVTGKSIGELMRLRELDIAGAVTESDIAGAVDVGAKAADAAAPHPVDAHMARVLDVMYRETHATLNDPRPSLGGYLNGQAQTLLNAPLPTSALLGQTLTRACAFAMATLEQSASMGVIVAAPTAGSSGVVPGVILAAAEALAAQKTRVETALWNAAAIGILITEYATVAGAEGGCQAEVGAAAAMAASALVELAGGTPAACMDAASIAIGNLLGLVCDPARGLVEYPCQNRNVIGVVCAVSAAQLALAHLGSPVPLDECIEVMASVGRSLPVSLRETAQGGLAQAPSIVSGGASHAMGGLAQAPSIVGGAVPHTTPDTTFTSSGTCGSCNACG